jgi:hypothetical protein
MMTTDRPAPVTIARVGGTEADLLVLGDSYIAYRSAGTTTVRNDDRIGRLTCRRRAATVSDSPPDRLRRNSLRGAAANRR